VFRIELGYGDIKWVIKRTVVDFYSLHLTLKFKANLSTRTPHPPHFPNQLAHLYHALTSIPNWTLEDEQDENKKDSNLKRREQLEEYLKELIKASYMMVNYDLCEFLEISAISITRDMGWKGKEGYLENRMESRLPSVFQSVNFTKWSKEWVILRDSQVFLLFLLAWWGCECAVSGEYMN
jgi:PX domain